MYFFPSGVRVRLSFLINTFWWEHMADVHAQMQGQASLLVCGDAHCDSPGSSAKYCTYTLMESKSKLILHSETVTRDMVNGSSLTFSVCISIVEKCYVCIHLYRYSTSHPTWRERLSVALWMTLGQDKDHRACDGCFHIYHSYDG